MSEAIKAYVEADDLSFVVDLLGKGRLRAGKINRGKHSVLDHETVVRGIGHCGGSIVSDDYAIPVDSGHGRLFGTGKPEDVKGPVVQQVTLCYAIIRKYIANDIALVIYVDRETRPGIGHNNQVKRAITYDKARIIRGPGERQNAHDLSVVIDGGRNG